MIKLFFVIVFAGMLAVGAIHNYRPVTTTAGYAADIIHPRAAPTLAKEIPQIVLNQRLATIHGSAVSIDATTIITSTGSTPLQFGQ